MPQSTRSLLRHPLVPFSYTPSPSPYTSPSPIPCTEHAVSLSSQKSPVGSLATLGHSDSWRTWRLIHVASLFLNSSRGKCGSSPTLFYFQNIL